MNYKTADLCDEYSTSLQIAEPVFKDYGATQRFSGEIVTLKVFENNVLVRELLEQAGHRCVLVVDGAASMGCALMGDQLAELASKNNWSGVVINGCIRDSAEIDKINIGVKALNTMPLKSGKQGTGERNIAVQFAGVTFRPGEYLYADVDGLVISPQKI